MTDDDGEPDGESEAEAADGRDPFGRLEEATADRDGDPFEALSDPDADEGAGGQPVADAGSSDTGSRNDGAPGSGFDDADVGEREGALGGGEGGDGTATVDPTPGTPEGNVGDPEARTGDPESRTGDPFTSPDSVFQRVDVGDVDDDDIWSALSDAEARGSVADGDGRTYAEVSKHRFCETCEHFTGPPEVGCTHGGTEILEFLDVETVRVVDCPVVEERRELQRGDDPGA